MELTMTKTTSTDWNPEQDLTALLDALTQELLTASERDIAAWRNEMGKQAGDMVQQVRRLIVAADADTFVPSISDFVGRGLRAYVARNQ
jgi:hypothetical protein